MTTQITFISSLYKTDKHIENWQRAVVKFMEEAQQKNLSCSLIAIANEPGSLETSVLESMKQYPWFSYVSVPRESFYASWNRGAELAQSPVCTSWNVDDLRTVDAVIDGLKKIEQNGFHSSTIVYFPFIYKRYVLVAGVPILVKRKKVTIPPFDKKRFTNEIHVGPFYLYTKAALELTGPYDTTYRIAGDFEWQARAASKGCLFIPSEVVSGYFHNDGTTLSGSKSTLQVEEVQRIINTYN